MLLAMLLTVLLTILSPVLLTMLKMGRGFFRVPIETKSAFAHTINRE